MDNRQIFKNRFGEFYIPDNAVVFTFEDIEADCINEWNSSESVLGFKDIDCFINYVVTSYFLVLLLIIFI